MTITTDRSNCPNVFNAGLPIIDYSDATHPDEAHAIIRQAREQASIAIGPHGPELLTYELVRTALRDPRLRMPKGMMLAAQGITSGPLWDRVAANLISLDGASHQRLRRLIAKAFTPRATERLRTTIVDVVTELVDRHAARGHCDVVVDIARQYPVPIICALLGAPSQDWEQFSQWTDDIFKVFTWSAAEHAQAIVAAWDALDAYVDDMVDRRRHTLTDDLVSELIRAEDGGVRLNADELRMLVAGLLVAGTDTTRNQVAGSVHVISDHPDQWELLAGDPDLAASAVEETMRHSPVGFAAFRMATEDIELGGFAIPAGTLVIANTAAANRDPEVFIHPDRLDITREGVPPILTFGGGVHYCLGSHLARLELAEALRLMTQRLRNVRRTGPAPWKPFTALSGPVTLPMAFEQRNPATRAEQSFSL